MRVACDVVAGLQVHGGQVAGFGLLGFQPRDVERNGGLAHAGLLVAGGVHPGRHVVRLHAGQLHGQGQRLGLAAVHAHQLVQRQALDAQVVLCGDLLGHDQVVARLGFTGVGHGGRADFEVALGRGQLLGHGCLLRPHEGQRVLRGQHVEVGLAHAHQQILRGGIELGLRHIHPALALLIGDAVGRAEEWLRGLHAQGLLRAGVAHRRAAQFHIGAAQARGERRAGQQAGTGLVGAASRSIELRPCRLPGGVVRAGRFHQFHQALRLRRGHEGRAQGESQEGQVA